MIFDQRLTPRGAFASTLEHEAMDASLPLLADVSFPNAAGPRFAASVSTVEKDSRRTNFVFRCEQTF